MFLEKHVFLEICAFKVTFPYILLKKRKLLIYILFSVNFNYLLRVSQHKLKKPNQTKPYFNKLLRKNINKLKLTASTKQEKHKIANYLLVKIILFEFFH